MRFIIINRQTDGRCWYLLYFFIIFVELKTGEGLKDLIPYKLFNRDDVLDEIQQVGFYCIFQPCADQLKEYPLDDIILVADPDEKYGAVLFFLLLIFYNRIGMLQ